MSIKAGQAYPQIQKGSQLLKNLFKIAVHQKQKTSVLAIIFFLSALCYLVVCVNVPFAILADAGHDDAHFLQQAYDISVGNWLGPYGQLTHAKGAGYPLFLAFVSLFHVPVHLTQALFFVGSIALLASATMVYSRSALLSVAVFEIALWNFGPESNRILRETIYVSQFVAIFSLLLLAFACATEWLRNGLLCTSSFLLGWFWVTREEGVVALPGLIVLLLYFGRKTYSHKRRLETSLALVALVCSFSVFPAIISFQNFKQYGAFLTTDTSGAFQGAMASLESIKPNSGKQYLATAVDVRTKAYAVSPTFAALRPILEDKTLPLTGYKNASCNYAPWTCGDYVVGWFMWAFRDAAYFNGAYTNAPHAAQFYRKIQNEIERGCQQKVFVCHHALMPFAPPISWEELQVFPVSMWRAYRELAFLDMPTVQYGPSSGPTALIEDIASFVNIFNFNPPVVSASAGQNIPLGLNTAPVKRYFIRMYSRFLPLLISLGVLAFAVNCYFCVVRRVVPALFVAASAAWLTIIVRMSLLALIDISSFPAINAAYLSFAFPLSCFAALVSLYLLFSRRSELYVLKGSPNEVLPNS